ncbi:MAG TPA: multiheme c-type cytochrome [Blastocatellia bacterium]|nr:multiheme c-type cytochrome [Blastocatellia bacterium]
MKRLLFLAVLFISGFFLILPATTHSAAQDELAPFRDNNCVTCHARTSQLALSNRYFQWHSSLHREKGVGCEKCHGGDPKVADAKKAHAGVLPSAESESRLNARNLPENCGSCHQQVVNAFIESRHYQKLKGSGLGPSCSTCHVHMGSEVITAADEAVTLCSTCHNSANPQLPKRPELPGRAGEVIQSIRRATSVVAWADRLVEDAQTKKVNVSDEEKELKVVHAMLAEAKTGWHAFNLDAVRRKADAAFEAGTKVKDALRSRIYPQQ